jgi:hypothetical protein
MGAHPSAETRPVLSALHIIEEPNVQQALDEARGKWQRFEDAWEALTWVIARAPEDGHPLNEQGNRRALTFEGARSIGMPTITATYEIERGEIIVTDVLIEDAQYGQAGTA